MMKQTKVALRSRPISRNRRSLYLDYYPAIRNAEMKTIRQETLGIYIFDKPRSSMQKLHNEEILAKAELIRCYRVAELINRNIGYIGPEKRNRDFLDYFKKATLKHPQTWQSAYLYFYRFSKEHCLFGDLDFKLCSRFREYLLDTSAIKPVRKLSINTAASYLNIFRCLLKMAYRDKILGEDLSIWIDKIKLQESRIEYLTQKELAQLVQTPCDIPIVKNASLFSCLTGLRYSDILQLTWEDMVPAVNGNEYDIRIKTQKTEKELTLPLSTDALKLCGDQGSGRIFQGLSRSAIDHPLKHWLHRAGIKKKVTFHSFRHTFAVLQIAAGASIYIVSRMLGHKRVATTERYVDLVDSIKREVIGNIQLNMKVEFSENIK